MTFCNTVIIFNAIITKMMISIIAMLSVVRWTQKSFLTMMMMMISLKKYDVDDHDNVQNDYDYEDHLHVVDRPTQLIIGIHTNTGDLAGQSANLHDDNNSDNHNKRYDVDDSGSMDGKELGRLLFTLIDNGMKVIDD